MKGGIVFVQLIQGKTSDKDGLHRQLEAWMSKLRPDAKGFLGTTGGVTDVDHDDRDATPPSVALWSRGRGRAVANRIPRVRRAIGP